METYQPIYDAVRSRISGGNIAEAVTSAIRQAFDISYLTRGVAQEFSIAAIEMQRPCVLFRPRLCLDGNQWCSLYGEDLQSGVAGFGDSPAKAMEEFDRAWLASLTSNAINKA